MTTTSTNARLFAALTDHVDADAMREILLAALTDAFAVAGDNDDWDEASAAIRALVDASMDGACIDIGVLEAASFTREAHDSTSDTVVWTCADLVIVESAGAWDWRPAGCRRHCWQGVGCDCDEVDAREEAEEAAQAKRHCNRHDDCDAADAVAREKGRPWAEHCNDECCEDCFGQ